MNPEELARQLPYMGDKSATSFDIADEMAKLCALIAGIAVGSRGDAEVMSQALENTSSDLGQRVLTQKLRLTTAIESRLNDRSREDLNIVQTVVGPIDQKLDALRKLLDQYTDGDNDESDI